MTKKPFKLIFTKDLENERVHSYFQYPNSAPIYGGWFVDTDNSQKHISCYLNNSSYKLQEHKHETLVLYLGKSYECETWTFSHIDWEYNPEEFVMRKTLMNLEVRGVPVKAMTGENPYNVPEFYVTSWGVDK